MFAAQVRLASRAPRTLVQRRALTTSAPVRNVPHPPKDIPPPPPQTAAGRAEAPSIRVTPARSGGARRFLIWTSLGLIVFYTGIGYASTQSEFYRDLFSNVPGGEAMADFADEHGWEEFGYATVVRKLTKWRQTGKDDLDATVAEAKRVAEARTAEVQAAAKRASERAAALREQAAIKTASLREQAAAQAANVKERAAVKTANLKDQVVKAASDARDTASKLAHDTKEAAVDAKDNLAKATGIDSVVADAEDALKRGPIYPDTAKPRGLDPRGVSPQKPDYTGKELYNESLPLGFEPPPGYYLQPPAKEKKIEAGDKLPLLGPKVKEFAGQEPVIAQLASTIDSLTSSLSSAKGGPSADASGILSRAQKDLAALNARIDDVTKTEKQRLEKTVAGKTAEFEAQLKQKEAEWQKDEGKLKETWESERQKMVDSWRNILDGELATQRHTIEERLREEVVSQGIELQRRWLRSIKSQVETERGGRLAKLDSLSTSLKQLERITLDNSAVLDDNVRLHKLWSALRAVQAKAERGDVAFDDEVRVLQAVAAPAPSSDATAPSNDNAVISAAISQLEQSGIPQTGVKSFAALSSWFSNSVAPRVHEASLVPAPENASVASHLASSILSKLMFRPKAGLVDGNDVGAVLARAEWALGEKDLDAAAREINSLRGWPRKLADDWLREARRRLEVQQALDIVGTEATLSSLLLV